MLTCIVCGDEEAFGFCGGGCGDCCCLQARWGGGLCEGAGEGGVSCGL